jgi:NitT/TauT family transport system permease protein
MTGALLTIGVATAVLAGAGRLPEAVRRWILPLSVTAIGIALWHAACLLAKTSTFPTPAESFGAIFELARSSRLWNDVTASLFRVTWGFGLAAAVGIPLGLWIGWSSRAFAALNPLVQGLRPISPIAWIPIAILWFGIGDVSAIFLIFLASIFPIMVGTTAAVQNIPQVYVRSASNFGLTGFDLVRRVVLPAAMPQIITSLRIALGVAWLVIVAAEMVGMQSGLGYLVNDARNMGKRYDLVVAAMILIGLIGIVLDVLVRQLQNFDEVRWGFAKR